jgi:hypothetical protein
VKAVRCLIVAITISSWLALSNHCTIGALADKAQTKQSGCPFHSKPAKPKTNSTECCKILRATSSLPAKTLAPAIVDLPDVDLAFSNILFFSAPKIFFSSATLDTGPPGKTSFAELNRSMRAHAPPFLV